MRWWLLSIALSLSLALEWPWRVNARGVLTVASVPVYPVRTPPDNTSHPRLALPGRVTELAVEIGLHHSAQLLPALKSTALCVVGFEPNAHEFRARMHHKHTTLPSNFILIPAAVSHHNGVALFKQIKGCSTLGRLRPRTPQLTAALGPLAGCVPQGVHSTRVATVTLDTFLAFVPPTVKIPLIKIDAQGHDLIAFESAGAAMHRVQRVLMEVQDVPLTHWAKLYEGPNTTQLHRAMHSHGFELSCCLPNNPSIHEYNCLFAPSCPLSCGTMCVADGL
eukprot:NODE_3612_length_936_cov_4.908529_g3460_i0.p1 GENE.NODE_3612_length_936_cov_4.908529_g3460_i0~~NODE_3612_length_936_cov_4.908529_g3460_i0.p1  ORF type:complete len:288 (+),score=73.35 NODE_3612_length_936_cov_4.908529_g3460_i0:32-865(+)